MQKSDSNLSTALPEFHIVIPARYASQRFPKKLLALLAGKPVLQWVYELSLKAGASSVVIATDHEVVFNAVSDLMKKITACILVVRLFLGIEMVLVILNC